MESTQMKVADEVWVALALLHLENPGRADFSEQEIKARARKESWGKVLRPGFAQHASYHCLANKAPRNATLRMLFETERGRRRLLRNGDIVHSERAKGKIRPNDGELLPEYRHLVEWYDRIYSKQSDPTPRSPAMTFPLSDNGSQGPAFADLLDLHSEPVFVAADGTIALPERLSQSLGIRAGSCLSAYREGDRVVLQPITDDFIRSLRGSCRPKPGEPSLVEMREREHRLEK